MNRIALAKRLESLSEVFASHTQYNRDLRAMSYVLNKMADDKFKGIISQDFSADSGMFSDEACGPMGPGVGPRAGKPKVIVIEKEEDTAPMPGKGVIPMSLEANEKTAGMFWNKDASKAVVDNLLRDVVGMNKSVCCDTGRELESNQVPDDKHKGLPETPKSLTAEQTPNGAESIESGMVAKSKGAVKKEAGSIKGPGVPDGTGPGKDSPECKMKKEEKEAGSIKGPGVPDGTGPGKDSPECSINKKKKEKEKEKEASLEDIKKKKEEAAAAKDKKDLEDLKKAQKAKKSEKNASEEEAEKKEEKDAAIESASSVFEGIELSASMDECELDATEAAELSKLFE